MSATLIQRVGQRLRRYRRNYRTRRQLLSLDAQALKDIGISRSEALKEAGKPFWEDNTDSDGVNSAVVQFGATATLCSFVIASLLWFF